MRSFLVLSLSAVVLTGCLTSQENPNYEHSTAYRGDAPQYNQYADNQYAGSGQYAGQNTVPSVSYDSPEAQSILAQTGGLAEQPALLQAASTPSSIGPSPVTATPPTDSLYAAQDVTGTPGYMAMQSAQQPAAPQVVATYNVTQQAAAPTMPAAQYVRPAPLGAAGTPVAYDYSRNMIAADAVTTGQQLPDTVRVLKGAGQNYTVQQGDTVYGLSRKTCVGVNVIQSMNGLTTDYAIQIGQSLTLPASVC